MHSPLYRLRYLFLAISLIAFIGCSDDDGDSNNNDSSTNTDAGTDDTDDESDAEQESDADSDTGPTCAGCEFDGECFADEDAHPENSCQVCDGEDWGAADDGTSCGENSLCADAQCVCEAGWTGPDCDQCVVYVDASVTDGAGDGSSWSDAFDDLQDGIDGAGDCVVWAAGGTYTSADTPATGFTFTEGTSVYGGFAGGESDLAQRDFTVSPSATIISGAGVLGPVVTTHDNTRLDGVVIADGDNATSGGGLFVEDGTGLQLYNVVFRNNVAQDGGALALGTGSNVFGMRVRFQDNEARNQGGAIFVPESSEVILADTTLFIANSSGSHGGAIATHEASLTMDEATFTANRSGADSAGHGGAIYAVATAIAMDRTQFRENQAGSSAPGGRGGAFYITRLDESDDASPGSTLVGRNINVQGNQAANWGGGMTLRGTDAFFVNLVLDDNILTQSGGGGGIFYGYGSSLTLINATITRNGGTITHGGRALRGGLDSPLTVFNSIIWDNGDNGSSATHFDAGPEQDFFYSIVQGETAAGTTFLEGPPEFVDLAGGNLHLVEGSLAIDKGDPETNLVPFPANDAGEALDFDGNPRVVGDAIDLGAFEYQN